ncbi:MAG: molybdopterin-synthase adenylyltransferase MoeB [Verrucomicrobiae bacterium]|nr:molybdopterin-synthase adenylyltransferase MoeB [Verrucomicrobiae bacterium]NNJ87606.1 molybdopterin-synthase adenylyltransferase MoeB [Akkermansiaceae bacterium]
MLSQEEHARYARHFSLDQVGVEGQEKLKTSSVLCIGAGGLGSPAALYLAAAGVGRIGLVDPDVVELSNLQRQILHGQSTLGMNKLDSAAQRLHDINPHVQIEPHACHFTAENAVEIAKDYDVIIDGTDNFPTRYLSNDVAYLLKKPNIYASIFRFEGQLSVFAPHLGGPCYRCMLPEPPSPESVPSCAEAGVLGVLPGIIGSLQAMEAIKILLGAGEPPLGRLIHYDALQTCFRELELRQDPECPLCGENPTIKELADYQDFCGTTNTSSQSKLPDEMCAEQLKAKLDGDFCGLLLDVRETWEHSICNIDTARLVPMSEIPSVVPELESLGHDHEILCLCKSGIRSARVMEYLRQQGFTNVCNITGGMDAWQKIC